MFTPILATIQNVHGAAQAAAEPVAEHMSFMAYIFHSNIINMFFVAAFLVWVAKKANLVGFLQNRCKQVEQAIAKAEGDKAEAQKILKDAEESVKDLDKKVAKIMAESKVSATSISEKIQKDTEQKLEEIKKNLEKTISVEEKAAQEELQQSVSKQAFEVASEKIKSSLNDDLHHKYIHNFIDSLDETKVK